MKTEYEQVREFMRAFGQECPDKPKMPTPEVANLRDDLFAEEDKELRDADDIVAAFDAVLDKNYVAQGDGVACGFSAEQMEAGMKEVHRSNMSKMWTLEDVESSKPDGCTLERPEPGMYIVRRADGKIVKSPSYSPPRLKEILEGKV